jgi:Fe2+ transport system protein FeoA
VASGKLQFHIKAKKARIDSIKVRNSQLNHNMTSLAELGSGKSAVVLELQGSRMLTGRLEAIGITPGTVITKKSAISARGPVVVAKGTIQFAVGYDMAQSILVEPMMQEE